MTLYNNNNDNDSSDNNHKNAEHLSSTLSTMIPQQQPPPPTPKPTTTTQPTQPLPPLLPPLSTSTQFEPRKHQSPSTSNDPVSNRDIINCELNNNNNNKNKIFYADPIDPGDGKTTANEIDGAGGDYDDNNDFQIITNHSLNNGNMCKTTTKNINDNIDVTVGSHSKSPPRQPPNNSREMSTCDVDSMSPPDDNDHQCHYDQMVATIHTAVCQNERPSPRMKSADRNPPLKCLYHHNNNNNENLKKNADLDTVHVIVGNEACDLDSAVSCLLMFHILSKMSDGINGKDKAKTLYIPLLNTTRDSLEAKSEVLWFLKKTLSIDRSYLTCKDDIDWCEIKKTGVEVLITLVDHNYSEEFDQIGKVVEIVDHHQIMNRDWLMANHSSIRLTLDPTVGSCTTLVAERLFHIYAEHHVADEILLLIYGTVLLDTICLSEKAKRFTRRDVYLLKKLDNLMGSKRPSRDELYKQLVEVKNTTKELNFEKLMKRDLKVFKDINGLRVGIASLFGMAAKEALGLAANINLDLFFQQHKYEAFIIMGLVTDLDHSDSISRDLVVISANDRLFQELTRIFEMESSKLDVDIIETNHGNLEDCNIGNKQEQASHVLYKARIYLQKNVSSSRKVVAPLVLKVLHDGVYRDNDPRLSKQSSVTNPQLDKVNSKEDESIEQSTSVSVAKRK